MWTFHLKYAPRRQTDTLEVTEPAVIAHVKSARIRTNEPLSFFCDGVEFRCICSSIGKSSLNARILETIPHQRGEAKLVFSIATLPKPKLEDAVFNLTQLGVDVIIVTQMGRSTARIKEASALLRRLTEVSIRACEISAIAFPPSMRTANNVSELIRIAEELAPTPSHRILFYEEESLTAPKIWDFIRKPYDGLRVFAVIGPEGGIEKNEVVRLKDAGFQTVSLGNRILESRSACYFSASALALWTERLGG